MERGWEPITVKMKMRVPRKDVAVIKLSGRHRKRLPPLKKLKV